MMASAKVKPFWGPQTPIRNFCLFLTPGVQLTVRERLGKLVMAFEPEAPPPRPVRTLSLMERLRSAARILLFGRQEHVL